MSDDVVENDTVTAEDAAAVVDGTAPEPFVQIAGND